MSIRFERPVFLMGAPRSCSTLLFQTLAQSGHLWSIGDESHHLIEQFPQLNPLEQADSNRVTADALDAPLRDGLRVAFAQQLRDRIGRAPTSGTAVRLLEKTPKNALRIPFLNALFPDALFIHLVRDPKDNLSSIMDAWRSRRFVTYPSFGTVNGPWSLLLPPGWRDQLGQPLAEVAAFQWQAAHRHILDDLAAIAPERRCTVNAAELLQDPRALVDKLFRFIGIPVDEQFAAYLAKPLPTSVHTLTPPQAEKWRRNGASVARVWPQLAPLIAELNAGLDPGTPPLDATPPPADVQDAANAVPVNGFGMAGEPSRNSPCPCGSGLRFKACHGQLP
jgi:hypothetical protein